MAELETHSLKSRSNLRTQGGVRILLEAYKDIQYTNCITAWGEDRERVGDSGEERGRESGG